MNPTDTIGGVLLVGEDARGALLSSMRAGFAAVAPTTVINPLAGARGLIGSPGLIAAGRRRLASRHGGARLREAVEQLQPRHVVLIKGRGIDAADIGAIRSRGVKVTCYYPDNPAWRGGDPGARERLVACDTAVLWSTRQADLLSRDARHVEVLPFGYDPDWFPLGDPVAERHGIAFLGTWSPRRERFLAAISDIADAPLTIAGTGWGDTNQAPIVEHDAGAVLRRAAIGVNLLHPQCAEAHNMRTREIAASGAIEITEPGTDGTPLRDNESCLWFRTPAELRARVDEALADQNAAIDVATKAQHAIAGDSYVVRGRQLAELAGIG